MRLFAGLGATDYRDLFRALGRELDMAGARDLRLVGPTPGCSSRRDARPHCGPGSRPGATTTPSCWRYCTRLTPGEDTTVGPIRRPRASVCPTSRHLCAPSDAWRTRRDSGTCGSSSSRAVVLQGTPGATLRRGFHTHCLDAAQLRSATEMAQHGESGNLGPALS